jgi:hypothetical protein
MSQISGLLKFCRNWACQESQNPHPVFAKCAKTRMGHPRSCLLLRPSRHAFHTITFLPTVGFREKAIRQDKVLTLQLYLPVSTTATLFTPLQAR